MARIVALESQWHDGKCRITDTEGMAETSKDPADILSFLVAPYQDCIKIIWDMHQFLKPIMKLLPTEIVAKVNEGGKARFQDFKIFHGTGKGAVFGVDWKVREHIKGNVYHEDIYESNIYELKIFYPNNKPTDIHALKTKGEFLLATLDGMGMHPTKLTSPAAIYEECVLRNMDLPTIHEMPEPSWELAEWAANYCREWRSCYKIGYFDKAYDYDLSAAYPSILAQVPSLKNAQYLKTNGEIPKGVFWGLLKGTWNITTNISPIVGKDDKCYKGTFPDYATTTELASCRKWGFGTFSANSGWFIRIPDKEYTFAQPMRLLFDYRNTDNDLQDRLAKNMASSTWGRFIQMVGEDFGDYYMSPIASMVTSKVRCEVCNFIYENQLADDLLSVMVDGCLSTKLVEHVPTERLFGQWRLNSESPALVLSSTYQWTGDKKPGNITLGKMVEAIKSHPMSKSWHGIALRFLEHDRHFESLPKNSGELLANKYESSPIDAVMAGILYNQKVNR